MRINSLIQFHIIINPNSGPGGPVGSQPDVNYQTCVTNLRISGAVHGNAKFLGYVATGYGVVAASTVTDEIDTYSGWAASYRPDGIFFDEVSDSGNLLPTYQMYATRVHTDFGASLVGENLLFATHIYTPCMSCRSS
jgi:hypothetical protein